MRPCFVLAALLLAVLWGSSAQAADMRDFWVENQRILDRAGMMMFLPDAERALGCVIDNCTRQQEQITGTYGRFLCVVHVLRGRALIQLADTAASGKAKRVQVTPEAIEWDVRQAVFAAPDWSLPYVLLAERQYALKAYDNAATALEEAAAKETRPGTARLLRDHAARVRANGRESVLFQEIWWEFKAEGLMD